MQARKLVWLAVNAAHQQQVSYAAVIVAVPLPDYWPNLVFAQAGTSCPFYSSSCLDMDDSGLRSLKHILKHFFLKPFLVIIVKQ